MPSGHPAATGRAARALGTISRSAILGAVALLSCLAPAQAQTQATRPPVVLSISVSPHSQPIVRSMLDRAAEISPGLARFDIQPAEAATAFKQLCQTGRRSGAPIIITPRALPPSIAKDCVASWPVPIIGVALGRTALVLAVRSGSRPTVLTTQQIYLAMARDVPVGEEFRRNTAIRWADVDPTLPPQDIRFQVPSRGDHRRHEFEMLVLEAGCRNVDQIKGIFEASQRTERCTTLRYDRIREIPHELAVRALLDAPPGTVGVLDYREIQRSNGALVAVALDGVIPSRATIQEGLYGFTSPQWLYARPAQDTGPDQAALDREIKSLIGLAKSEAMIGPGGLLEPQGLIPLPDDERAAQRVRLTAQEESYSLTWLSNYLLSTVTSVWDVLSGVVTSLSSTDAESAVDLSKLMDTAGYKLAEFESELGLIPGAAMSFKITREMSDGDRDFLERELYKDARARQGFGSALQRRLIQAIIDTSESNDYQVTKVDITLLPLPNVKLTIAPRGSSGSESASVMRAIERLQERLPETVR